MALTLKGRDQARYLGGLYLWLPVVLEGASSAEKEQVALPPGPNHWSQRSLSQRPAGVRIPLICIPELENLRDAAPGPTSGLSGSDRRAVEVSCHRRAGGLNTLL